MSKTDEFLEGTPISFEIVRCENTDFAVKWFSHWRRDPGAGERGRGGAGGCGVRI